jgi:hypothetical protein
MRALQRAISMPRFSLAHITARTTGLGSDGVMHP